MVRPIHPTYTLTQSELQQLLEEACADAFAHYRAIRAEQAGSDRLSDQGRACRQAVEDALESLWMQALS